MKTMQDNYVVAKLVAYDDIEIKLKEETLWWLSPMYWIAIEVAEANAIAGLINLWLSP